MRYEDLQEKVLERIDLHRELDDDDLIDVIEDVIRTSQDKEHLSLRERSDFGRELFNSFRKYDVLQELLEDERITEIMINGTESIFIERAGRITRHEKRFTSAGKLEDVIQQIVGSVNRTANERVPIADARLPDGSRVNVVLRPAAINGPVVTIRKFPKNPITMRDLIAFGSIGREAADFLKVLVAARYNIFVSGGTGSGKTTFLNALSEFIPEQERIITIEDNAELQLTRLPNLVRLEARDANMEGVGEITIRDLIRTALRMRPDRIIVGEVRGDEAIDMLQAMNTGHDGSLSTGHANSPEDMISRLETMVLAGMDIPLAAVERQIASAVDLVVHLGRLRDGSRKVLRIVEVTGYGEGRVRMSDLYRFVEKGEAHGQIRGVFEKENDLQSRGKLLAAGCQTV
ncbi:MAG: CpaF family protein [Lachnospiraceae bacterium]|nr:CpaF family protein [Lachnospiraceae bacterium]